MPPPNVSVPYEAFRRATQRHDQVLAALTNADPKLQKLVAELIMMRMFDEFQGALEGVALRLACGASYADGSPPTLLVPPANSTASAKSLYENYGRAKPKNVKWSKVKFINETTKYVLGQQEAFLAACRAYAGQIAEMQAVRNRIAHRNQNSRAAYAKVVQSHYGAKLNSVAPGTLLLTQRFTPPLLSNYIKLCRVVVRDCTRS